LVFSIASEENRNIIEILLEKEKNIVSSGTNLKNMDKIVKLMYKEIINLRDW